MIPQLPPYMPTEYLPGSYGRYRQYPRSVRAQIPGTGYDVGRMRWAEQQLNLTGNQRQSYGNYANVPLRGLGEMTAVSSMMSPAVMTAMRERTTPLLLSVLYPAGSGDQGGPAPYEDTETLIARLAAEEEERYAAELREAAAEQAGDQPTEVPLAEEEEGFFDKKLGPVPIWALGIGGVLVVGGGAWFMLRKKPKKNRRRRRRR